MLRRSSRYFLQSEGLWAFCKGNIYTNTGKVLFAAYKKDLPNPSLPTPLPKVLSHDTDILLNELRKAKTIDRNLELTAMHIDVMNANHIVLCLLNIHEINKIESSKSKLTENRAFQALCSKLMKVVRLLEPQDLVNALKSLTGLQIRNNSYVMQSLFKMIGSSLNDMNLGQLIFLNFILSKQRPNSLVEGLKLALPLVLQVQIEQQLDSDNVTEVVECLQLACRARLKPSTIQKILFAVLDRAKMLSADNAITTIFGLLNLEAPLDGYKELLNYCLDVVSSNIESLNIKQLLSLLRLFDSRSVYNSRLFFAIADKITSENWSLKDTYQAIVHFIRLNFAPSNLKDHFVKVICSEANLMLNDESISVLTAAKYLAMTGYKPENIQEALSTICASEGKIFQLKLKAPNLYIKLLSSVAILGHFPQELSEVLNEDNLFNAWSTSRKQGKALDFESNTFSLFWSLEVYDQQEKFPFLTGFLKKLSQSSCERNASFEGPLQKFLENGLGGSQFLHSCIFTQDGIQIDHVLGMRSGNYPITLHTDNQSSANSRILFVEDVILPNDAKLVAVIVAHQEQYCRDPEVLRGWMDIKIRALKKKKYYPVVINYTSWSNLPDREKIPFLMREVKNAVEENISSSSNILC